MSSPRATNKTMMEKNGLMMWGANEEVKGEKKKVWSVKLEKKAGAGCRRLMMKKSDEWSCVWGVRRGVGQG